MGNKTINKMIIQLEKDTITLRKLASQKSIPYEKSKLIRKEQDELWKKLQFLKGISNVREVKDDINKKS